MFTGLVGLRVFAASELNESLFTNAPSQAGRPSYIAVRRRSAECSRTCPGSRRLMRIFLQPIISTRFPSSIRQLLVSSCSSCHELSFDDTITAVCPAFSAKISKNEVLIGGKGETSSTFSHLDPHHSDPTHTHSQTYASFFSDARTHLYTRVETVELRDGNKERPTSSYLPVLFSSLCQGKGPQFLGNTQYCRNQGQPEDALQRRQLLRVISRNSSAHVAPLVHFHGQNRQLSFRWNVFRPLTIRMLACIQSPSECFSRCYCL